MKRIFRGFIFYSRDCGDGRLGIHHRSRLLRSAIARDFEISNLPSGAECTIELVSLVVYRQLPGRWIAHLSGWASI